MKKLAFSYVVLLCGFTAFGQNSSEPEDKAPPAVDEALRARVNKFYDAFVAGKFKDAYLLVAEDSQDKFFELSKDQYKGCEIIKVAYSDHFTRATVVTSCKNDWRWHGVATVTTFPLTSTWEVIDGQWYWHFVKPTMVPSPFSPTGFVPVPPDSSTNNAALVPSDIAGAAHSILSKVGIDKSSVRLRSYGTSEDIVHVRNDMPGQVSLKLENPDIPGLKVSLAKTTLEAHEQTTLIFEWHPDDSVSAKNVNARATVQLHVEPTNQVFPISVVIENTQTDHLTPAQAVPQK